MGYICVGNLKLDSQSKTAGNLAKELIIIK